MKPCSVRCGRKLFCAEPFKDGYGPNLAEYQHFINDEQVQLIVTVDNGVAGNEAINYAQEHGVDVVITDHHEMPDQLPNAYAIVHPRHPEGISLWRFIWRGSCF